MKKIIVILLILSCELLAKEKVCRIVCWNGEVWQVWQDGKHRCWLPKLDKSGKIVKCQKER